MHDYPVFAVPWFVGVVSDAFFFYLCNCTLVFAYVSRFLSTVRYNVNSYEAVSCADPTKTIHPVVSSGRDTAIVSAVLAGQR